MFYSKSTGGFYSTEIHGSAIPSDAVSLTGDEYEALMQGQADGFVIVGNTAGSPELASRPAAPTAIASQVTMRQARLALLSAGLLSQVNAAIESLPEPDKTAAKIDWEYSAVVQRSSGLVPAMGAALGMTEAAIDALFTLADTL